MLTRAEALLNGPQSRPKPCRPLPATTPSAPTFRAMIAAPHAKFADPSFNPATEVASHPFARAVCGDICKSPIYCPPPPDARGFHPLSGFAKVDNRPAQNARRSVNPFLAYPGHHALISPGTTPAKTLSYRATAASVAPVHTAASGRASQPIAACASPLVRPNTMPSAQPDSTINTRHKTRFRFSISTATATSPPCGKAAQCRPTPFMASPPPAFRPISATETLAPARPHP